MDNLKKLALALALTTLTMTVSANDNETQSIQCFENGALYISTTGEALLCDGSVWQNVIDAEYKQKRGRISVIDTAALAQLTVMNITLRSINNKL